MDAVHAVGDELALLIQAEAEHGRLLPLEGKLDIRRQRLAYLSLLILHQHLDLGIDGYLRSRERYSMAFTTYSPGQWPRP